MYVRGTVFPYEGNSDRVWSRLIDLEQDIPPDLGAVEAPLVIGERSAACKDVGAGKQGCKRAFFFFLPFLMLLSFNDSILDVRTGAIQGSNGRRGEGYEGNQRAYTVRQFLWFGRDAFDSGRGST